MMTRILLLFLPAAVLAGCKKNYTCYCGDWNSSDKTAVFEVKDTKKKAEAKCQEYHHNMVHIPEWSCEIK